MNLPAWLTRIFLLLAGALLGWGYWSSGYLPVSITLAGLAVIGLVFLWRGWGWGLSVLLVLFTGSAAAGFYLEVAPAWLISGMLAGLISWDQEYFASQLKNAGRVDDLTSSTHAHLVRLGWVSLSGLMLVSLTYFIQIEFTFGTAVLLAGLAVLGLSQGVAYLRRVGS